MPQSFVTAAVLAAVRRLPAYPRLSVVDLSCGSGEILLALKDGGCRVRGTQYRDDDYIRADRPSLLKEADTDRGLDLHRRLPFADGEFDVVLLTEVLEHLESHVTVISEAGRILREGGHLVLSSPNLQRIHSRARFFWTGTHKLIRRRVGWDVGRRELYAYHIGPVDFPYLHTLLYQAGLRVAALDFTRFKLRHAWLALFYPLIVLRARIEFGCGVREEPRRGGERDLYRWMVHPAMLFSEQLLLTARREVSAGRERVPTP